jgi:hypothetical protein
MDNYRFSMTDSQLRRRSAISIMLELRLIIINCFCADSLSATALPLGLF